MEYPSSLAALDTISVETRVCRYILDEEQREDLLKLAIVTGRTRPQLTRVLVAETAFRRVASSDRWVVGDIGSSGRAVAANRGLGPR